MVVKFTILEPYSRRTNRGERSKKGSTVLRIYSFADNWIEFIESNDQKMISEQKKVGRVKLGQLFCSCISITLDFSGPFDVIGITK